MQTSVDVSVESGVASGDVCGDVGGDTGGAGAGEGSNDANHSFTVTGADYYKPASEPYKLSPAVHALFTTMQEDGDFKTHDVEALVRSRPWGELSNVPPHNGLKVSLR